MLVYTHEPDGADYMAELEYTPILCTDTDERGPFTELDYWTWDEITYHDNDGMVVVVTIDELEDLIGWEAIDAIEIGVTAQIMETL